MRTKLLSVSFFVEFSGKYPMLFSSIFAVFNEIPFSVKKQYQLYTFYIGLCYNYSEKGHKLNLLVGRLRCLVKKLICNIQF